MTKSLMMKMGILVAGALLATALVACGGGGDDDGGDGGNGNEPTSSASTPSGGGGDDEVEVTNTPKITSKNTLFDTTELKSKPGQVTLTHDNQDAGVVHNVRVYKGEDADGEDMGGTELEAGPIVQTLELELDAGDYFYVCESHPATMYGSWEVE